MKCTINSSVGYGRTCVCRHTYHQHSGKLIAATDSLWYLDQNITVDTTFVSRYSDQVIETIFLIAHLIDHSNNFVVK